MSNNFGLGDSRTKQLERNLSQGLTHGDKIIEEQGNNKRSSIQPETGRQTY